MNGFYQVNVWMAFRLGIVSLYNPHFGVNCFFMEIKFSLTPDKTKLLFVHNFVYFIYLSNSLVKLTKMYIFSLSIKFQNNKK